MSASGGTTLEIADRAHLARVEAGQLEELPEQDPVLVGGAVLVRLEAPGVTQDGALEHPDDGVRVSDVDGE